MGVRGSAGEQESAQFAFQAADHLAERRLAHVELFGRAAEKQFGRQRHERLELA